MEKSKHFFAVGVPVHCLCDFPLCVRTGKKDRKYRTQNVWLKNLSVLLVYFNLMLNWSQLIASTGNIEIERNLETPLKKFKNNSITSGDILSPTVCVMPALDMFSYEQHTHTFTLEHSLAHYLALSSSLCSALQIYAFNAYVYFRMNPNSMLFASTWTSICSLFVVSIYFVFICSLYRCRCCCCRCCCCRFASTSMSLYLFGMHTQRK